jgi:hypothetical protein
MVISDTSFARLRDKGVKCPSNCIVCNDIYEDTLHIMFLFPLLVQIWPDCGLWNFIDAAVHMTETVTAAVFDLLQNVDDDQAQQS